MCLFNALKSKTHTVKNKSIYIDSINYLKADCTTVDFALATALICFVLLQIDLRDDPKTLARLLQMKEKPLTYEQGLKLAREV